MIAESVFFVFIIATTIQLFFWLGIFSKLAFFKEKATIDAKEKPVSVIICAKNEAENLQKNLPRFLNQNYRSFEVIIVNDYSTDKTVEVVLNFQAKYPNLRLIHSGSTLPGKKAALSKGIEAAFFEIIAVSDADCYPASLDWLKTMQSVVDNQTQIGLGYSPYYAEKRFLNLFIRFETVYTATQYLSFALIGLPYMGVGRNLIYTKPLFQKNKGFHKHMHIASGDDDLFIKEAANALNTKIVLNQASLVYSVPKQTWRGYYYQKSRHLSTATNYKIQHKILLGLLSASHVLHFVCAVALLAGGVKVAIVLFTCLVRTGVVSWMYQKILKKLYEPSLLKWVWALDVLYVLFYFVFAPALLIGRKDKWK